MLHRNRKRKCDFGFVLRMAHCDPKSPKYNKLYISFNSISFTKRNRIRTTNKKAPLWVLAKWRPAEVEEAQTEKKGTCNIEREKEKTYNK